MGNDSNTSAASADMAEPSKPNTTANDKQPSSEAQTSEQQPEHQQPPAEQSAASTGAASKVEEDKVLSSEEAAAKDARAAAEAEQAAVTALLNPSDPSKGQYADIPIVKANYDRDTSVPGQRKAVPMNCQVQGCGAALGEGREYFKRCRICEMHLKLPALMRDGQPQRFCQQCCRFHSVNDFEGDRRSCRTALGAHNGRRRKRSHGSSKHDDSRHRKRSRRSTSGRSNSQADTSQDESDQRFTKTSPLEVPSDMLLPPIGHEARAQPLTEQHLWSEEQDSPEWASRQPVLAYGPRASARMARRRNHNVRLVRYQAHGSDGHVNLVPQAYLRKPPPTNDAAVAKMGRSRVTSLLSPNGPRMARSQSGPLNRAPSQAYVHEPFGRRLSADDYVFEDFAPQRAYGKTAYDSSGRIMNGGRQRYVLIGDHHLEEELPEEEHEESEDSMTFGAGGEEADRHMLIRDEELRDYLNEAERRCSRVALESLVPMLPDDPTIQFNRYDVEGGPGMLPGSPYDSALDGTEAAWYPPGRFQDLLAADDHPKTPEGLQDTSQSQHALMRSIAAPAGSRATMHYMPSTLQPVQAPQHPLTSPDHPIFSNMLNLKGPLGSLSASDEQTVHRDDWASPNPTSLSIDMPATITGPTSAAASEPLGTSLQSLQPLSPLGTDFLSFFQDSSGGPLQLPPIDDTTLQGLQDLLPPGKDVCDFS